jgi:thymidylate synthase (FAD)
MSDLEVRPRVSVLDAGYVQLIDRMGCDARIVESARMSTGGGFKGWEPRQFYACPGCEYRTIQEVKDVYCCPNGGCGGRPLVHDREASHPGDQRLLSYLWKKRHTSPFEQCEVVFEVKAPILVFREWHRHRTQAYNEMSARYAPIPDEHYMPERADVLRRALAGAASANKQEAGSGFPEDEQDREFVVSHFLTLSRVAYNATQRAYDYGLKKGIPKELARISMSVGRYSVMRAKASLLNWLRFCSLRSSAEAQEEIRMYSLVIEEMLAELYPRTIALYRERPL